MDFQKILERTIAIASQPITQLQTEQANVLTQKTLALGLQSSVSGLATAVKALGDLGASKALGGTSSNTSKVTIGSVTANSPATYTLSEITSVARGASATSAGYASSSESAVSATGTVLLTFDGETHEITLTPEENNLTGLRDKINELGIGLSASILTTGTGATPYYLSLSSNTTGEKPITLVDDPLGAAANLLETADNGANAVFKVNGVPVSKPSNLINDVVSGVTFTIAGTTAESETVTLSLSTNRSTVANKLKDFVTAYNTLLADTDAQIGESAGLLTGDYLVREAKNVLRSLSGYLEDGTIGSLTDLGIEFGSDGKAKFNQQTFDALSDSALQDAFSFFGSSATGFGALQSDLTQLSDPVSGLIAIQTAKYDETDKRLTVQIEEETARLVELQKSTAGYLQTIDALLGSLESQQTIIDASFKSLELTLFGKQEG
jgi:flagellar hook-associated protein 2